LLRRLVVQSPLGRSFSGRLQVRPVGFNHQSSEEDVTALKRKGKGNLDEENKEIFDGLD
jgi:hypothetical protein